MENCRRLRASYVITAEAARDVPLLGEKHVLELRLRREAMTRYGVEWDFARFFIQCLMLFRICTSQSFNVRDTPIKRGILQGIVPLPLGSTTASLGHA